MKLDRIVLDFLVWIKEQFWKAPNRSPVYLYDEIARFDSSRGYLKLVRRDTPRAIATWVFIPKRNLDLDSNILKNQLEHSKDDKYKYDVYICCDHLFALMPSEKGELKKQKPKQSQPKRIYSSSTKTHKISVLLISHFLQKDGTFESVEVFSEEYDMSKRGSLDIHREAMAIVQSVAMLLKYRPINDWHFEIESYRKEFLGSSYTPTIRESNSFAVEQSAATL